MIFASILRRAVALLVESRAAPTYTLAQHDGIHNHDRRCISLIERTLIIPSVPSQALYVYCLDIHVYHCLATAHASFYAHHN